MSDFDAADFAKAIVGGIALAFGLFAWLVLILVFVPGPGQ